MGWRSQAVSATRSAAMSPRASKAWKGSRPTVEESRMYGTGTDKRLVTERKEETTSSFSSSSSFSSCVASTTVSNAQLRPATAPLVLATFGLELEVEGLTQNGGRVDGSCTLRALQRGLEP
ncbi:unnamed protein product [Protopolystoma xenopodis]|uniref:Uncharacterized protein n=1 Tax=Protopolystoma xenopodis TaxID=117903 RepID=A0A3S5FFT2_9PLAT|nr:unnamed protein product [Protopolystoma xenopodis]